MLFALEKLRAALGPLIGRETSTSSIVTSGWSEAASRDDVQEWEKKGIEATASWDEDFWRLERDSEQAGWLKVRSCFLC